jgi:hypothetical protein
MENSNEDRTEEDDEKLKQLVVASAPLSKIVAELRQSISAVKMRAHMIRVPLGRSRSLRK